jgi:hypothetical protein
MYGLHTKRGREIEFSLDAQYSRGSQLITDTGREGVVLSLIKLAKDCEEGGDILPFRRLSLYDALAYSNFPLSPVSFPLSVLHLSYFAPLPSCSYDAVSLRRWLLHVKLRTRELTRFILPAFTMVRLFLLT